MLSPIGNPSESCFLKIYHNHSISLLCALFIIAATAIVIPTADLSSREAIIVGSSVGGVLVVGGAVYAYKAKTTEVIRDTNEETIFKMKEQEVPPTEVIRGDTSEEAITLLVQNGYIDFYEKYKGWPLVKKDFYKQIRLENEQEQVAKETALIPSGYGLTVAYGQIEGEKALCFMMSKLNAY